MCLPSSLSPLVSLLEICCLSVNLLTLHHPVCLSSHSSVYISTHHLSLSFFLSVCLRPPSCLSPLHSISLFVFLPPCQLNVSLMSALLSLSSLSYLSIFLPTCLSFIFPVRLSETARVSLKTPVSLSAHLSLSPPLSVSLCFAASGFS